MDIVILADFCGSFDHKDNSRFLYLADMLTKDGHAVEIITSNFDHGQKQHFKKKPEGYTYNITMLPEPAYSKNVCLQRFNSHYKWGIEVREYLKKRKKPDVIYAAIPTLKASLEAAKYCNKNGIKFVIDIQDLWPEAFKMVFNIPVISDLIFLPFGIIADGIYKRADSICAVSNTYVNRALKVNKKCKEGHAVFLGTDLSVFDENVKNNPSRIKLKNDVWLGYCGTLGNSYDLTCAFDALKRMGDKTPMFIVMGNGPRRKEFEEYANQLGINVNFTGLLPYPEMCSLLSECDIAINPIIGKSAASIINKHADYVASGLPVINTQECVEYRELVKKYHMGFNCENNNPKDLAEKITVLVNDEKLRKQMGKNARRCAEEKFDRKKSYYNLVKVIEE